MTIKPQLRSETWVRATWAEYLETVEAPECEKAKGYYYNTEMRIEMPPVGADHADDNSVVAMLINLFGIAKQLPIRGLTNCSFRKPGVKGCQPDLAYYVGERVALAPKGNSPVDLNQYQPPDLAIEISATTLSDDLGKKRLLYEELGISEYWVVDVENARIIAFSILEDLGSQRINESRVLAGLSIALLEAGLQHSRSQDNSQVGAWFLSEIQK